jgi:hypothetical protein
MGHTRAVWPDARSTGRYLWSQQRRLLNFLRSASASKPKQGCKIVGDEHHHSIPRGPPRQNRRVEVPPGIQRLHCKLVVRAAEPAAFGFQAHSPRRCIWLDVA